jgi:hypothetical protein
LGSLTDTIDFFCEIQDIHCGGDFRFKVKIAKKVKHLPLLTKDQKKALAKSIADCIEKALSSKFGENVAYVIFANFHARFDYGKEDVISHPKEFEQILDDIFGTGVELIKHSIFDELASRFKIFDPNYYEKNREKSQIISKAISEILEKAK